jgi:hypothetical protein
MAAPGSGARFIGTAAELLTGQGWHIVDAAPASFDMVMAKEKSTVIVHTQTVLFFVTADGLSREERDELMEQAHALTGETATAPLFPATAVVVYVYTGTIPAEEQAAKKRDLARGHATVAWTVTLADGTLRTHTGTPLVRDGKRALEQALHALTNDG